MFLSGAAAVPSAAVSAAAKCGIEAATQPRASAPGATSAGCGPDCKAPVLHASVQECSTRAAADANFQAAQNSLFAHELLLTLLIAAAALTFIGWVNRQQGSGH